MTSLECPTYTSEPVERIDDAEPRCEQLSAALEAGQLFVELSARAKLAALHDDQDCARTALRQCSNLAVAARRIGSTLHERNLFESIATQLSDQLQQELTPRAVSSRWRFAVDSFLACDEYESAESPYVERMIGNLAIGMITSTTGQFHEALCCTVSLTCQEWFEFGIHVQRALFPSEIVDYVFPDDRQSAGEKHCDPFEDSVRPHWLSEALLRYLPPQRPDLANTLPPYSWRLLVHQRAQEIGMPELDFLKCDDSLTRSEAVARIFSAATRHLATDGTHLARSLVHLTEVQREKADSVEDVQHAGDLRLEPAASPPVCQPVVNRRTFGKLFGVMSDDRLRSLRRAGSKAEARCPGNKRILWQLTKYLLSADEDGRTLAAIREKWGEFGGKGAPSKRTIENNIVEANALLEALGLSVERRQHNGPWLMVELRPMAQ